MKELEMKLLNDSIMSLIDYGCYLQKYKDSQDKATREISCCPSNIPNVTINKSIKKVIRPTPGWVTVAEFSQITKASRTCIQNKIHEFPRDKIEKCIIANYFDPEVMFDLIKNDGTKEKSIIKKVDSWQDAVSKYQVREGS